MKIVHLILSSIVATKIQQCQKHTQQYSNWGSDRSVAKHEVLHRIWDNMTFMPLNYCNFWIRSWLDTSFFIHWSHSCAHCLQDNYTIQFLPHACIMTRKKSWFTCISNKISSSLLHPISWKFLWSNNNIDIQ